MKAIRYYTYGSAKVLELHDLDMPAVGDDDVLIRVRAASVNPLDWHFMRGMPYFMRAQFGLSRPKTNGLGADLAGHVEAVGKNVTTVRPGDEVFGCFSWFRGIGSLAEYVSVSHLAVSKKPANLTFEQAASIPVAGFTALQAFRDKAPIRPGHKVLVNGAAGGVGTFAVQIAKSMGAEVTGVCSTGNVALVRSLGADHVVDYTKEDFLHSGQRYDTMLDNAGNRSLAECRRALAPKGTYLSNSGAGGRWLGGLARGIKVVASSPFVRQRMVLLVAHPDRADLDVLRSLIEDGKVTPVVDRTYPLSDTPEAIDYLERGHAKGKVVISV